MSALSDYKNEYVRHWPRRIVEGSEELFSRTKGWKVVLLSPLVVARSKGDFLSSFQSDGAHLLIIIEKALDSERLSSTFSARIQMEHAMVTLSQKLGLHHKLKQTLSDDGRTRKIAVRNFLIQSLSTDHSGTDILQ